MIPLSIFDYSQMNIIDLKVTRYVNICLAVMIELQLMMLRDDPDLSLEYLLPRDYVNRQPHECRNLIDELYEMVTSDVIRDLIKPKYQYLLFNIISCWEASCEDVPDLLIPYPMKDDLLHEIQIEARYIDDDGVNIILELLQDYNAYYEIPFFDYDFSTDNLSNMIKIYLNRPDIYQRVYPDVNLDDYLDLMPVDLRELYIEKNLEDMISFPEGDNIEFSVVLEIYKTLQRFQKRVADFENRGEVEISNDICDALASALNVKYGLNVSREAPMGRALVELGETDLYIYKEDESHLLDLAIVENKLIEKFSQQYNQLLGYLNHYFNFGITISINKKYSLDAAIQKIKDTLLISKNTDFPITDISEVIGLPYVVKSLHTIPEDQGRQMPVYHMVLHLCDLERRRAAKEARAK